jgi:hypothetical protein
MRLDQTIVSQLACFDKTVRGKEHAEIDPLGSVSPDKAKFQRRAKLSLAQPIRP